MKHPIPDAALLQHIAVLGKTGSGKTSTAKLAIEQVVAQGARVCVLDPIKSDWWGLTSSSDGKRPGLPFHILGGPRGHVPLHASAGKAIAEIVASGALPLSIIDMADFEPGGQSHFFVHFAPALIRKMRGVVYLVIEEAHLFAPKERSGVGAESMSIHWAKTLATAGRSKGIRLILLSQRTQALHNALLGSCDTIIAHRMTAPADQEPVLRWLKSNAGKEVMEQVDRSISSIPTGSGWLCSGEAKLFELREFPRIKTYDNTATPTGDGEEHAVKTAPVDQEKLRAIVGDAVKDAEASDPKALKARIRELEKALTTTRSPPVPVITKDDPAARRRDAATIKRLQGAIEALMRFIVQINAQGFTAADPETTKKAIEVAIADVVKRLEGDFQRRNAGLQRLQADGVRLLERIRATLESDVTIAVDVKANEPFTVAPARTERRPPRPSKANGSGDLPRGEASTLAACIQFPEGLRREQLTVLTGYKRSSRDTYIQRLRERGLVEVDGERLVATDAGREALPDAEPLPTGEALQRYWLERLPEGERVILKVLLEAHPHAVARTDLDEQTGYKRSSRDTYLQRLGAKQLVVEAARGEVKAAEDLF